MKKYTKTVKVIAFITNDIEDRYENIPDDYLSKSVEIPSELKSQATIQIYNNAGQLVNNVSVSDIDQYMLDVKQYPAGLYSYILTGAKTYNSRFVVQH